MTTCPELRYGCRISQGTAWIYVWVTSASSHPPVPKWLLLRYDGGGEVPGITEALTPFHWGLPPTTGRRWQQILWPLWFSSQSKWRAGRVVPVSIFLGCPDCPCFFFLGAPLWQPLCPPLSVRLILTMPSWKAASLQQLQLRHQANKTHWAWQGCVLLCLAPCLTLYHAAPRGRGASAGCATGSPRELSLAWHPAEFKAAAQGEQ